MRLPGWVWIAIGAILAGLFAFANRYERVSVSLGVVQLYAVPLAIFFFAAFLLGMAAMLLLSLPQDRRTRDLLRAHGLLDAPAPTVPSPPPAPPRADPLATPADPRDAVES